MIYDPYQSRKLIGKHAELYAESLGTMLDVFRDCFLSPEDEEIWVFGVQLFDELSWRQKLGLLLKVSRFALGGKGDPQEWEALEKAACYSVYQHIFQQLEIERDLQCLENRSRCDLDWDENEDEEIDGGEEWKMQINLAYTEDALRAGADQQEILSILDAKSFDDLDHWHFIINLLADRLVDDRDFELAGTLMDADPELTAGVKSLMGIGHDYFVQTADELSLEEARDVFDELATLCGVPMLVDSDYPPY